MRVPGWGGMGRGEVREEKREMVISKQGRSGQVSRGEEKEGWRGRERERELLEGELCAVTRRHGRMCQKESLTPLCLLT